MLRRDAQTEVCRTALPDKVRHLFFPDAAGGSERIGSGGRRNIPDPGVEVWEGKSWPAWVTGGGEGGPGLLDVLGQGDEIGGWWAAQQPGRQRGVGIAEGKGHV